LAVGTLQLHVSTSPSHAGGQPSHRCADDETTRVDREDETVIRSTSARCSRRRDTTSAVRRATGLEALELARTLEPDVAILDSRLPVSMDSEGRPPRSRERPPRS